MEVDVITLKKIIDKLPDPQSYKADKYMAIMDITYDHRKIIFERRRFTDGSLRWCISVNNFEF